MVFSEIAYAPDSVQGQVPHHARSADRSRPYALPPVQVSLTALADSKTGRRFIKSL